jgi:polysaccharide export outer membrane protein
MSRASNVEGAEARMDRGETRSWRSARVWRRAASLLLGLAALVSAGLGQAPTAPLGPPSGAAPASGTSVKGGIERIPDASPREDDSYRIGPGDLLDVRVYGRAELTREVRVTNEGRIRLPFLDEVQVACQTEAELSEKIATQYRKYLRDPQVDVFVREYKSQPVSVIGSVMQPGRFQLQRRVRLLELLTFAGGPGGSAGGVVHVIRGSAPDFCEVQAVPAVASVESSPGPSEADQSLAASQATIPISIDHGDAQLVAYRLRDVLVGNPESNPFVRPGDIISVPETDQIFVTGAVIKPGAIPMRSRLTLLQALGIAGGFQPDAARSRVRIIRLDPQTRTQQEIVYNIDEIQRRKAEDVVLLPNDVVHAPSSMPKSMGRGILGVSLNMLSTIPFLIMR